ncbi:MAG: DNA polymerase I [Fusobacteriaceae bacterium]
MKTAVLLDTSAIMYRAFYANPHFKTKNEHTGAVYGFIGTLLKIIKEFTPDYMAAAFDVSRSSLKRTEIYGGYKAKREAAPEDLISQISRIEELLDCFNIKRFKVPTHEADDVLGTLATKLSQENYKVIVVTGDKDLAQIIDKNISIALLGKGEGKDGFKILATDSDVVEHLGVHSDKVPDLFGLVGDTSDGIPGVRKIGPKKAIPMLEKYGNLEGIYENLEFLTELPGIGKSLIQNMIEDKELAFLSRKLAIIDKNLEELKDVKGEDLNYGEDTEKLREFYTRLEFKMHLKRLVDSELKSIDKVSEKKNVEINLDNSEKKIEKKLQNNLTLNFQSEQIEKELIDVEIKEKFDFETHFFKVVNNLETFENMKKEILEIENKKISIFGKKIALAISTEKNSYFIPLKYEGLFVKNLELDLLNTFFKNELKIFTYDLKSILELGIKVKKEDIILDIMIGYHLLTSSSKFSLELIMNEYFNESSLTYEEQFKKKLPEELDSDLLAEYLTKSSKIISLVGITILNELKKENLEEVWKKIELPLIEVLYDMEKNGIKIDTAYFKSLEIKFNEKLEGIKSSIYKLAKKEFNINSPKQLGEILFIDMNLPILKKNKTGPSTDVDVLEGLRDMGFEIAEQLLEHRKLSKLVQTYVEPLPKLADKKGRLHSSFNQIGTATGRLSSSNPNLQNIPVKSEEGILLRKGFVVEPGKKLLGIDYSQIELRVLTEFTEDVNLVKAYKENQDLHEMTARKIFDLKGETSVTREQRTVAKIVNFSLIYGKTAFGLAKELKISNKEAVTYIDAYFSQYPRVKEFEMETLEFAQEHGYVTTLFGRKREIEGINSRNRTLKMQAERTAVNTIIQGTAAEIIKVAMVDIYEFIKGKESIKLVLQVHDELIFEVDEEKVDEYKEKIENLMTMAVKFKNVNLEVNGEIGDSWAETK